MTLLYSSEWKSFTVKAPSIVIIIKYSLKYRDVCYGKIVCVKAKQLFSSSVNDCDVTTSDHGRGGDDDDPVPFRRRCKGAAPTDL